MTDFQSLAVEGAVTLVMEHADALQDAARKHPGRILFAGLVFDASHYDLEISPLEPAVKDSLFQQLPDGDHFEERLQAACNHAKITDTFVVVYALLCADNHVHGLGICSLYKGESASAAVNAPGGRGIN